MMITREIVNTTFHVYKRAKFPDGSSCFEEAHKDDYNQEDENSADTYARQLSIDDNRETVVVRSQSRVCSRYIHGIYKGAII